MSERREIVVPQGHPPMSHADFARSIGVSPRTLAQWVRAGLPTQRFGLDPAAAAAWISVHRPDSIAFDRRSVVYFARRADGLIKIGFTSDLDRRLPELRKESRQDVEMIAKVIGGSVAEMVLHRVFAGLHVVAEWFEPGEALLDFIAALRRPDGRAFMESIAHRFDRLNERQQRALEAICADREEEHALRTLQSLETLGHIAPTEGGWSVDEATREAWAAWSRLTGSGSWGRKRRPRSRS